jgi:hypothetical protein
MLEQTIPPVHGLCRAPSKSSVHDLRQNIKGKFGKAHPDEFLHVHRQTMNPRAGFYSSIPPEIEPFACLSRRTVVFHRESRPAAFGEQRTAVVKEITHPGCYRLNHFLERRLSHPSRFPGALRITHPTLLEIGPTETYRSCRIRIFRSPSLNSRTVKLSQVVVRLDFIETPYCPVYLI